MPTKRATAGAGKAKPGRVPVKAFAVANESNIAGHLCRHEPGVVYLQPWERWIPVLIVPDDGSYIVTPARPARKGGGKRGK